MSEVLVKATPHQEADSLDSVPGGSCPLPITHHKQIVLGHGSGGKLSAQLLEQVFLPAFGNPWLDKLDDQAVLQVGSSRLAFTTDSFVVTPIFFPGGDIGKLAVNGTINDLAMSGARPLYLSAAFILEEGLETADLLRIVQSMSEAAKQAGIHLVQTRVGSMMTCFFTSEPVVDWNSAKQSDTKRYGLFFHKMLEQGVYLAPSQFEAAFLSTAHGSIDIENTIRAARRAFKSL